MNRTYESVGIVPVSAPATLAADKELTAGYICGLGRQSIDFVVQFSALAEGKTLNVEIYHADDDKGTGAEKIAEATFTAPAALTNDRAIASVKVAGNGKVFYGVKVSHDNSSSVHIGVLALCEEVYTPLDVGWVLQA